MLWRLIAVLIFGFNLAANFFRGVYLGPRYGTCPFAWDQILSQGGAFDIGVCLDLHGVCHFFFLFFHPLACPFSVHEPSFPVLGVFVKHFGPIKESVDDSWKIFIRFKGSVVPSDEMLSLGLNETYQLFF